MKQHASFHRAGMSRRAFLGAMGACALAGAMPAPLRADGPLRVLAATYPAWLACDAAARGVPGIEIDLLVAAQTGCPHDYAMTPRDRMKLEDCDVLVLNGGGFECFLDDGLLASLKCDVVDAGEGVGAELPAPLFEAEDGRGHDDDHDHEHEREQGGGQDHDEPRQDHEHDHDHGHNHGHAANPHWFASPSRFALMTANAASALAARRPERAGEIRARAEGLAARMAALAADMRAIGGDTLVVAQHSTLSWYFADTSLRMAAVLQEEADEAPSAADLLRLIERMRRGGAYLLAGEPQFPSQVMDTLAAETGARRVLIDTMASGDMAPAAERYETVMRENLARLAAALGA